MVKPLDAFLRDHVRAPLKTRGFSKKRRDFRLTAPNGDMALINFFSWRLGDCEVEFFLDAGIVPRTQFEWVKAEFGEEETSIANTLWWMRLNSPFKQTGLWQFNLDDSERISFFVGELNLLVDRLKFLIDRQNLIDVVRDPAAEVQRLRSSREHALALLLVDEGSSGELEEILQAVESHDPGDPLAAWVRAKLA